MKDCARSAGRSGRRARAGKAADQVLANVADAGAGLLGGAPKLIARYTELAGPLLDIRVAAPVDAPVFIGG